MSQIFGRKYELKFESGGEEFTLNSDSSVTSQPARITFTVDVVPSGAMAVAEINIYGLGQATREQISEQFGDVTLATGVGDVVSTIFTGVIRNVQVMRQGADIVVTLFCLSVRTYADAVISKSWGESTPAKTIIEDVAGAFGLPVRFYGDFSGLPKAIKGRTISGSAKAALDELSRIHDFEYVISISEASIYKRGPDTVTPGDSFKYTPLTGLIGSPILTEIGADFAVAMNPAITPYSVIEMENDFGQFNYNGIYFREARKGQGRGRYQVLSCRHVGDFYGTGPDWRTEIIGIRLDR